MPIIHDDPVWTQIFQAPAWERQQRTNIANPEWIPHRHCKNSWLSVPVLSWHTSLIKRYVIAWWKSTATSLSLRGGCAFPINLAQSWFNAAACRYPNPAVWERFSQSLLIYQNSSNFNEFSLCCIDMAFRINFSFQQAAGTACYLPSFVEYVPSKSTLVSEE